jgi:Asp-tRNA(Asn)/Glu-tRNA(Gln) amidotransferase B subunit
MPRQPGLETAEELRPDLPKGYQISQFDRPVANPLRPDFTGDRTDGGKIVNRREKAFGVTRLHMEDDAGKSIHEGLPETATKSYVNLNRTGVPLAEIVSEPDFRSSQEAYDYMTHLRKTLLYLEVCDGNMEEGSLRCDANVSVRPKGSNKLRTKLRSKTSILSLFAKPSTMRLSGRAGSFREGQSHRKRCGTTRKAARSQCAARRKRTITDTS